MDRSTLPRVLITTDLEVDDQNGILLTLLFADQFDLAGIVWTAGMFHFNGDGIHTLAEITPHYRCEATTAGGTVENAGQLKSYRPVDPGLLTRLIDVSYRADYEFLSRNSPNYPTPDELLGIAKTGNVEFEGDYRFETEGSELIKSCILDDDPRPLCIQHWGGINTTVRALISIYEQYHDTPEWDSVRDKVVAKVRLDRSGEDHCRADSRIDELFPGLQDYDWHGYGNYGNYFQAAPAGKYRAKMKMGEREIEIPLGTNERLNPYYRGEYLKKAIKFDHGQLLTQFHLMNDGQVIYGEPLCFQYVTPNLPLFQNDLDQKMRYIADAGLVNAVGYAWGYDMEANGQARYIHFAKYTAARYGAYPVIWTLAGELPGYGAAEKLRETVELWNPVAKEAEKWCAYENLQTVHLANSRPFARIYADETWFDFALCQSGHGDFDMSPVMYKELREMYAGHPVIEGETTYEGIWSRELVPRYVDADTFRRTSYLMLQMGGAGTSYGANGVWELQWEAGVGGIGWGDMAWYDGLELPGAWQMTVLREFYESVDWGTLSPLGDDRFTTGGGFFGVDPSGARSVYALGNDDMTTVVLYYQPTSMPIYTIKGLTAEVYALYEVDTETGKRQKVREIRPEQGVYREMPAGGFRRSHGKPHDQLFVLKAL